MAFADDYVPVADRIISFRERFPEGSLRPADPSQPFRVVEVNGETFLAYTAAAFRTPDDPAPGIGCAWEPVPGKTNFTRNSELQNAESSAWGRAIIAVGAADAKRGIASAEDVRNRRSEQEEPLPVDDYVPGLRSSVLAAIAKLDDAGKQALIAWFAAENLPAVRKMNVDQLGRCIDHLMQLPGEGGSEVPSSASSEPPSPEGVE